MPEAGRRPWVVSQHVPYEGPGLVARCLEDAGWPVEVVRPDRGERFPDVATLGGLVVMGGPMGVGDGDLHPWLGSERDLLAAAVDAGLPVLGVCLGAQQLAAALGGTVTTGPGPELGVGTVTLTPAGRVDPVFGPEYGGLSATDVPCVHWYQDTFSLPGGAVHLAATRTFPHQAFRVGRRAYGLQFHVEVDAALAEAWRPHLPGGMELDGPSVARIATTGRRLLQRFVALADGDPG
jgi:GMP synthase (glutamine-hydrolysing)